ncbi:Qa-SNARE_4 [Hexamita inflata]|uniref:Qa-SNARE 4 n=1 Tax=Hexamita inflata TaxID=28002 RepID=A0AA86V081_9EUKA|nr:Qa-SNARE 4 [Hexamita inflata]
MNNITDQFVKQIQFISQQSSYQPQQPKILEFIRTIKHELQTLLQTIDVNRHAYTGNMAMNYQRVTMTATQCLRFEHSIRASVQNIRQQISNLVQVLSQQLQQESADLETQVTRILTISENGLQLQFWLGAFKCLQNQCDQVIATINDLKDERKLYCGENIGQQVHLTVQSLILQPESESNPDQTNPNQINNINPTNQIEEPEPQNQPNQYWSRNTLLTIDENLNEYMLAQRTLKTALEIQSMQSVQSTQIQQQSEQINRIQDMAVNSHQNLEKANKLIKRAKDNLKASTKTTVVLLVLSIAGIIFLDKCR